MQTLEGLAKLERINCYLKEYHGRNESTSARSLTTTLIREIKRQLNILEDKDKK